MKDGWRRVSHEVPCPICKKTDWCMITTDGVKAICQRIESTKKVGEAGWLHDVAGPIAKEYAKLPPPVAEPKRTDLPELAAEYAKKMDANELAKQAENLGVTTNSLINLSAGIDCGAVTFPMKNSKCQVVGIMRRFQDGNKLSVKGGTLGLFIPSCLGGPEQCEKILICEGATDTAAALSVGFYNLIGRPNCGAGGKMIRELVEARGVKRVIIISDNDDAGVHGARELAKILCGAARVKIITPPAGIKDMRDWHKRGCTRQAVSLMTYVSPEYKL